MLHVVINHKPHEIAAGGSVLEALEAVGIHAGALQR
jgi:hypothetical protein